MQRFESFPTGPPTARPNIRRPTPSPAPQLRTKTEALRDRPVTRQALQPWCRKALPTRQEFRLCLQMAATSIVKDTHLGATIHLGLRFSDRHYPVLAACHTRRHTMYIDNATIYSSLNSFVPKGHAVLIVPKTRTTESYKSFYTYKKRSRSRDFKQLKPPDEIVHIKYLCCLLMASRLFVFVSGGQGKC